MINQLYKTMYLDTSVYGGYFDIEFRYDTRLLFDVIFRNNITLLVSDIVEVELNTAPKQVKEFYNSMPNIERVEVNAEINALADEYINEKVVGKTSQKDCLHIALATIHKADILVSWNFKHIVNLPRIKSYNSINMKNGYQILEIRNPKEVFIYENE